MSSTPAVSSATCSHEAALFTWPAQEKSQFPILPACLAKKLSLLRVHAEVYRAVIADVLSAAHIDSQDPNILQHRSHGPLSFLREGDQDIDPRSRQDEAVAVGLIVRQADEDLPGGRERVRAQSRSETGHSLAAASYSVFRRKGASGSADGPHHAPIRSPAIAVEARIRMNL